MKKASVLHFKTGGYSKMSIKKYLMLITLLLTVLLPVQALAAGLPADGKYEVEVKLSGGSGKAQVESPAALTVENGKATAVVIWSSPNYEYMLLDGAYYYPINTEGNSTFEVPVVLDEDMAFSAETTAMSKARVIDYTLRFDSATIKRLPDNNGVIPIGAVIAAAAAIPAAGICIAFFKKRANKSKPSGDKQV